MAQKKEEKKEKVKQEEAKIKDLNLYQKISAVMAEIKDPEKKGYNSFQNYNYILEADVVSEGRRLFAKYGIVLKYNFITHREKIRKNQKGNEYKEVEVLVQIEVINADNPTERETYRIIGEGQDSGDKAFYKAYTGAMKYFLLKNLMLGSDADPENETTGNNSKNVNVKKVGTSEKVKNSNNKPADKPATDKQVELIKKLSKSHYLLSDQKAKIEKYLEGKLTMKTASKLIQEIQNTINELKEVEAAEKAEAAEAAAEKETEEGGEKLWK